MKNKKRFLALGLVAGLSLTVFAWRDRNLITVNQQIAIYSLANRYVEALCNNPSALLPLFNNTIIPSSLLSKSSDYLTNLKRIQGECFGQSKDELQEELLQGITDLPEELIRMNMATELTAIDFLDCLVEVEAQSLQLTESTMSILDCIDRHLDVRGFWYELFVVQFRLPQPVYAEPITIIGPSLPPPPISVEPGSPNDEPPSLDFACYDSCVEQCNLAEPTPAMPGRDHPSVQ